MSKEIQKPVAVCWRQLSTGRLFDPQILTPDFDDDSNNQVFLYLHPPESKPLTDEEIEAMWPLRPTDEIVAFARAIEAKLKEKNT